MTKVGNSEARTILRAYAYFILRDVHRLPGVLKAKLRMAKKEGNSLYLTFEVPFFKDDVNDAWNAIREMIDESFVIV